MRDIPYIGNVTQVDDANILEELPLTNGGGDEDDVLLHRKVVGAKGGELATSKQSSKMRTRVLVYEASRSGVNR